MAELVQMPKLGFDMAEGTLVRWVKTESEAVSKGEILAEIETDKATVEVESPYSGIVYRHLVPQGEIVPVGQPIAIIAQAGEEVSVDTLIGGDIAEKPEVKQVMEQPSPGFGKAVEQQGAQTAVEDQIVKASPLARRMAAENELNLSSIAGSGPGGRIVKRDIEKALALPAVKVIEEEIRKTVIPTWQPGEVRADEVMPLNRLRQIIARRMTESKQNYPHFYITHEYDVDALLALRLEVNEAMPEGEKLSVNDFIMKAAALALRRFPNLNASIQGDQIIRHGKINLGVAVAVEGGLLTIVCKDADQKPIRVIAAEIRQMVERARDGKVRPEDIEGSTFSISNLGMFDVEHFAAIINPPEAAILAVGSAKQVPVVKNGALAVGNRMRATISADHRVSDGAEAAKFMQVMAEYIETPIRLLL